MKVNLLISFAVLTLLSFYSLSCDKIQEATTLKIPVPEISVSINIPLGTTLKNSTADTLFYPFSLTKTLSIDSIEGLTSDAKKHLSQIDGIEAESAFVTMTTDSSQGSIIKDFTLHTDGINPDFTLARYTLGEVSSVTPPDYVSKLILKALPNKPFDLTFSGSTDIIPGKNLKLTFKIKNVKLLVNLLK